MTRTYVPKRDRRFEYATEAGAFIERTNCAKGCIHAIDGTRAGPGWVMPDHRRGLRRDG